MEMEPGLLFFRWMHVLAAVTAGGAIIFMRLALLPAMSALGEEPRKKLHEEIRSRWSKVVMVCILALLISGFYNYFTAIQKYDLGALKFYHPIVGTKILLAFGVFFISSALVGRGKATEPMRAKRKLWLTVNAVLIVTIVLLSGVLRMADKKLKSPAPAALAPQRAPASEMPLPIPATAITLKS